MNNEIFEMLCVLFAVLIGIGGIGLYFIFVIIAAGNNWFEKLTNWLFKEKK